MKIQIGRQDYSQVRQVQLSNRFMQIIEVADRTLNEFLLHWDQEPSVYAGRQYQNIEIKATLNFGRYLTAIVKLVLKKALSRSLQLVLISSVIFTIVFKTISWMSSQIIVATLNIQIDIFNIQKTEGHNDKNINIKIKMFHIQFIPVLHFLKKLYSFRT